VDVDAGSCTVDVEIFRGDLAGVCRVRHRDQDIAFERQGLDRAQRVRRAAAWTARRRRTERMIDVPAGADPGSEENVLAGEQIDVLAAAVVSLMYDASESSLCLVARLRIGGRHDLNSALNVLVFARVVTNHVRRFAHHPNVRSIAFKHRRNALLGRQVRLAPLRTHVDDDGDVVLQLAAGFLAPEADAGDAFKRTEVRFRPGIGLFEAFRVGQDLGVVRRCAVHGSTSSSTMLRRAAMRSIMSLRSRPSRAAAIRTSASGLRRVSCSPPLPCWLNTARMRSSASYSATPFTRAG